MLKVKVLKAQQQTLSSINIPVIRHSSADFLDGVYPVLIRNNTINLVLTCKFIHTKNSSEICLADHHRKTLSAPLHDILIIEHYKNIHRLSKNDIVNIDINIVKIPGYSLDKIALSREKLTELVQTQLFKICINNQANYAIQDIETERFIIITINITGDNHNICYYDSEPIQINKVNMNDRVKTKCVLSSQTSNKSVNVLKTLDLGGLGIGGLKTQILELLRRVYATRACSPEMIEALNISHVKGVLLYGPPGTGKTLIARQLGNMLDSVPPIIVNGPEIMSKYVGESAENIRRLFAEAEKEYKSAKEHSKLHVIIFDEFDAIAGNRSSGDSTGAQVGNQIVNQLLSKMDGVDSLNNILIFGLTNRKELIDSALLRPGRFEVQLEIGVPDERGRKEIFDIHLKSASDKGALSSSVKIDKLAKETDNFTGAEIAGVVRNATSFAICREINDSDSKNFKLKNSNAICIYPNDLSQAIKSIDPLFGKDSKVLDSILPSEIELRPGQVNVVESLMVHIDEYLKINDDYLGQSLKLLITGDIRSGKSIMAVHIAKLCNINSISYLSNFDLIGDNDYTKNRKLKELFLKATSTEKSVVILDDIDNLMEVSDTKRGLIFNNGILQTLSSLWSKAIDNKIIFIMTAQSALLMQDIGLLELFHNHQQISGI
jgi:vesicle-fusing ATPase